MPGAYLVLVVANLVFATSYAVTRVVLQDVGPATLGLARAAIGAAVLAAWAGRGLLGAKLSGRDRGRVAAMGMVGFAGAFALGN